VLAAPDCLGFRERAVAALKAGITAITIWLALLSFLGAVVSQDFFPRRFVELTLKFKDGLPENLPLLHPGRWIYNAANGWVAPFVLNQRELNFGRYAVLDSARQLPLGALALLAFGCVAATTLWHHWIRAKSRPKRGNDQWLDSVSNQIIYLILIFLATGLAAYYEAFLYSQLIVPVLLVAVVSALSKQRLGSIMMWTVTLVLALNSIQQIHSFRTSVGL
jgi:hypothetical protein